MYIVHLRIRVVIPYDIACCVHLSVVLYTPAYFVNAGYAITTWVRAVETACRSYWLAVDIGTFYNYSKYRHGWNVELIESVLYY